MSKIDPIKDLQQRLENLRKARAHLESFNVKEAIIKEDPNATEADLKEEELFHRNKIYMISKQEQALVEQLKKLHAPERNENEDQKIKRLIKEKLAALTRDIERVDSLSGHDRSRLIRRKTELERVLAVYEKHEIKKGNNQ